MATIGFVGDVYPGPGGFTFGDEVLGRLREVDLLVANLEGPLTAGTKPAVEKRSHLRSAPETIELLKEMGVGVVSLANNHMFDFGKAGFAETTALLDDAGIAWVGAGDDLASARRPLVLEADGLRFGILAYSSPAIETMCAGTASPGCAPLEWDVMEPDVKELAERVDVPIVLLHWGLTGYRLPTPEHKRLGDRLLDAGARLVVGSHPHVAQGMVLRADRAIAFSLGDFAFYPATASGRRINQYRSRQTGTILTFEVEPGRVDLGSVFHTRQRGTHVGVETSTRHQFALGRASTPLHVSDEDFPRTWKWYVARRTVVRTLKRLAPWKWRTINAGAIDGFRVALRELRRR